MDWLEQGKVLFSKIVHLEEASRAEGEKNGLSEN